MLSWIMTTNSIKKDITLWYLVMSRIGIKQATKDGVIEMSIPGVCDLSYPTSKLRRGRVQGGVRYPQQLQQRVVYAKS